MKHLVLVPAYNEEHSLAATLSNLDSLPEEFEVLVVDDGSADATAAVAEQAARDSSHAMHVLSLPTNCGIGATVQTGYLFALSEGSFRYVVQFDGDGQHDAASIPLLVEACESGGLDLCVGSRFLGGTRDGFRSTPLRRAGIRFFAWLISRLTGAHLTDPTSGFRCAGPRAWRRFARDYPDDYPEPESLARCCRSGLHVGELPVRMHPRQGGASSIHRAQSVYYMLKVTLAILIDRVRKQELTR